MGATSFKVGDRVEWVDGMHAGPGVVEEVLAEGVEYIVREDDHTRNNLQRRRDMWSRANPGSSFERMQQAERDGELPELPAHLTDLSSLALAKWIQREGTRAAALLDSKGT